ncbi:MAG: glycoside hydrolase family 88 protein [Bacteroidota bacterium]|nr:glycoside hydrolase family 88 protein [Bacteroidota bacterium]
MKQINLIIFLCFVSLLGTAGNALNKKDILKSMQQVADWELTHFEAKVKTGSIYKDSHAYWSWTNGAMYIGMFDWATLSKENKYFRFLKAVGEKEAFKPGPNLYHADDICVSQLYLQLFLKYKDSCMIKPTLDRMNFVLANRSFGDLDFSRKGNDKRWSWCDALFMAPAAYARASRITGDRKYANFMDQEFKVTYDTLFDQTQHLFFRDTGYKNKREANGEKIFWGRGNGWVIGGLCMIIDNLPQNHPTRTTYIKLYQQMMERIAGLQDKNGFWHSSLLDPQSYPMPETSCSGFFTYGLAWGINKGFLPAKKYKPIVQKAWKALRSAVQPDGKLGWVQPIGADPKSVTQDMTDVYGVGAFLMAGCQIYKLK